MSMRYTAIFTVGSFYETLTENKITRGICMKILSKNIQDEEKFSKNKSIRMWIL